jgi:hypothetical protein
MAGFSKVFSTIWGGSLHGHFEASAVFLVFLSLADREGTVDMTPQAIAGTTGWPLDFILKGIAELESPDPKSRTEGHEGRRILPLDEHRAWGWLITNYSLYRDKMRSADRTAYLAEKQREYRARAKYTSINKSTNINQDKPIADADADAKKIGQQVDRFRDFWKAYPKKVKKKDAERVWKSKRLDSHADRIISDITTRSAEDGRWQGGFIPDPPTYLRGERWHDEITERRT